MAQYDLHLHQNVHATGIEFTEKMVNIAKGGLLSADASKVPTILPVGTNGYQLVADSATATGLKWQAISAGHTQGTDTGTTSDVFHIDSDDNDVVLRAPSPGKLQLLKSNLTDKVDLEIHDLVANGIAIVGGTITETPTA